MPQYALRVQCIDHAGRLDLLSLHRLDPRRFPHLFESAAEGANGRYDILFCLPGESLVLSKDGRLSGPYAREDGDFLASFDDWYAAEGGDLEKSALPFKGGWIYYLGYELARQIEPTLSLPDFAEDLPIAFATRMQGAIIRDRLQGSLFIVVEAERAGEIDALTALVEQALVETFVNADLPACDVIEDPAQRYLDGVKRIRRYVHNGDVFQVNLSRAWQLHFTQPVAGFAVYTALRNTNPAPFAALMTWGDSAIVSSSPERLVLRNASHIETRPIAGTRRRGHDEVADRAMMAELIGHPKERAEHIMLIDLERNDLGRVCRPGTIEVNELMTVESYAHVHHIVSNVRGQPREGLLPGQLFKAVFPGGTITGCPKVRCMEILAELEQTGRGPYTGTLGYLNLDGTLDSNILIRTIFMADSQRGVLRTGAGIVADSIPERELDETRAKARGLLLALGEEAP